MTCRIIHIVSRKCNSALGHGTFGIVILPTVVSYSRMLARLAIGLDKQPHLIAHLKPQSTDEGGSRETLPERAANIIRQAFTTCLNDRSGAASGVKDGKPDGKKVGIYKIANLCLKVLFQCRKTRNAEQMFVNIDNQSPPLSVYPRGERVTYLYYLGRFLFSTSHFWRAQVVLQRAYDECRTDCVKQRRLIVIYLIASNVILGRFPSNALLQRPESAGLADKFLPICFAIRKGDLSAFRRIFALTNPDASWYLHFRIHLQLQNRCEILVWRSLFRKTFLLNGSIPDKDSRSAPTLGLEDVVRVANYLENSIPKTLTGVDYTDPDLDGAEDDHLSSSGIDMLEVESITTSLLVQGLLGGYVSHRSKKFAILGARQKGALDAGFPNVWQTIKNRPVDQNPEDQVPGWAKEKKRITGGFGPGTVINLSGARAVGSAP